MSEYIGARISLISKSDIRYVGTLVNINSEQSTVSLDNVRSFGTEGRRGGKDEYGPSDAVYEQIVFRGSDVKDLRIEETPKEEPQMPQDPAIIGVQQSQRQDGSQPEQRPPQQNQNFPPPPGQFPPGGYPPFGHPPPPYHNRFGPQGGFPPGPPGSFPGGPGGFGMPPYGFGVPPPGWGPPGQAPFNGPHGPFPPQGPIGPPGQQQSPPNQNQNQPPTGPKDAAPVGPQVNKDEKPNAQTTAAEVDGATKTTEQKPSSKPVGATPTPATTKQPPPPPVDSKPPVAAALAPPAQAAGAPKTAPTGPKSGRIVPAVPLASPGIRNAAPHTQPAAVATAVQPGPSTANPTQQYHNATQAATAAVAAAMAKLDVASGKAPAQPGTQPMNANLQQRIDEMRDEQARRGGPSHRGGSRGGRGGRGGHHAKLEIPATDFDFASANAKFNKMDSVKEAIATGSPLGEGATPSTAEAATNGHGAEPKTENVVIPPAAAYNKSSSFFDNISSELKDREESAANRGQQFRTQERAKNMETFGQGSVDGYRGGYRGRGRGRGRSRGRGFGGFRGGRGGAGQFSESHTQV